MERKEQDLISVLVPLYNVEKYIGRCIESIQRQTYQNFEIIVVNDGSSDQSLNITQSYASQDKRIKIINNSENMGLAWTRRVGYSNALGNYIVFCDSDDYMPEDALRKLYYSIVDSDVDIVVGNYQLTYSNERLGEVSNNKLSYGNDQKSIYKSLLSNEMSHSLWGKIFKIELFKDKSYLTHKGFVNSEDGYLLYQVIANCSKVALISDVVYNYYQNLESSTNSLLSEKAIRSIVSFWNLRDIMFKEDKILHEMSIKRSVDIYCKFLRKGYSRDIIDKYIEISNFQQYLKSNSIIKLFPLKDALIKIITIQIAKIKS